MKILNMKYTLRTLALVLGFAFFGIANQANAQQLIVQNNTGCDLSVRAVQQDGACNSCGPVYGGFVTAGNSTTLGSPISPCPNFWYGSKYQPSGALGSAGVTYSTIAGPCGTDLNGNCGGAPINHAWFAFEGFTVLILG